MFEKFKKLTIYSISTVNILKLRTIYTIVIRVFYYTKNVEQILRKRRMFILFNVLFMYYSEL